MADDDKEVPTESTDDEIPVIEEETETFEVEVEEFYLQYVQFCCSTHKCYLSHLEDRFQRKISY